MDAIGDDASIGNRKIPSSSSSYWLDACEEDMCCDDLITLSNDFHPPPPPVSSSLDQHPHDSLLDPCFFGGIDGILDSIRKGAGFTPPPQPQLNNSHLNNEMEMEEEDKLFPNNDKTIIPEKHHFLSADSDNTFTITEAQPVESTHGNDSSSSLNNAQNNVSSIHPQDENCVHWHTDKARHLSSDTIPFVDRFHKKSRIYRHQDHYPCRGTNNNHHHPRDRKRPRDQEEFDRRDRDRIRRNERNNGSVNGKKDCRENRGYWERDRSKGSGEMVFHPGSWEADRTGESKVLSNKTHDSSGEVKKAQEPKEKVIEEHVRKYQLDVLQQAENRNTIAFLETGAGKTLIAVLLIESLCSRLQKTNKKFLAVFLVPKVPLVYQVKTGAIFVGVKYIC